MRIPFRDSIFPNAGHQEGRPIRSSLSYLELYMAVHNCKDLIEEQVMELQGLLAEKLKNRRELQTLRSGSQAPSSKE
ncbi:MAG: hypothetical protein PVH37_05995 [Desulfobacterales bacterium]